MKKLSLNEIKEIELAILKQFDQYCKNNNLKYYLVGGTLLGAIRHKGFIPWDDDIDVCMSRPDYERFINGITKNSMGPNLQICEFRFNNFDAPFCKIININTMVINKFVKNNENSKLWIDIVPVDGLPEDINRVIQIYRECSFYRKLLVLCNANLGEGKSSTKKWLKYVFKPIAMLCGKNFLIKRMIDISQPYPYENSNYVGAVTWGLYGKGERMLKREFEESIEVEFEGYYFPTFSCWDSYLQGLFGDYMQLPPIEERKTHDMEAYLLENEDF